MKETQVTCFPAKEKTSLKILFDYFLPKLPMYLRRHLWTDQSDPAALRNLSVKIGEIAPCLWEWMSLLVHFHHLSRCCTATNCGICSAFHVASRCYGSNGPACFTAWELAAIFPAGWWQRIQLGCIFYPLESEGKTLSVLLRSSF